MKTKRPSPWLLAVLILTLMAAVVAVAGLIGYIPGLRALGSIRSGYIPMAPSTAVCFLIFSVVLLCFVRKSWQGSGLMVMIALVILATVFGLREVVGAFVGLDLNLKDWLVPKAGTLGGIIVGRMSPVTAATFITAGLGTFLLLLQSRSSRHAQHLGHWASSLGILTVLVGATVLLAYLYGTPLMYGGTTVPMAATTALAFLFLGAALVAAVGPESYPMCLLTGESNARKREEENLRRMATVVKDSNDAITIQNFEGGITAWNRGAELMYGYSEAEAFLANIDRLTTPGKVAEQKDFIRRLMAGEAITSFETQRVTKDGHVLDVWMTVTKLMDDAGKPIGLASTERDITERKRAAETLRALSCRQEAILAAIPDIVTEVDRNNKVITWSNKAGFEFFGEDMIGKEASFYFVGEQETYSKVQPLFNGDDRVIYVESWQRRKDGEKRLLAWWCRVLKDAQGTVTGALSTARDITERKKAEEEKAKLETELQQAHKIESVGLLASGIAHDFNNIMQIILGNVDLALAQTEPDNPLRPDLEEIQSAGRRGTDLTSQLLGFARKQTIDPKTMDLNATVEDMLKMLYRLVGKNIEMVWKPRVSLWPIRMDPVQIHQILVNLCSNARDVITDVGAINIATENVHVDELHAVRHDGVAPGDYVLLTVGDTGCGMDKETQGKIFEPFFTTKAVGKGTGLGLPTVYGIVQQNKGYIGVYSEPEIGTTFRIYLPRYMGNDAAPAAEGPAKPLARGSETVLLVEDDTAILDMSGRFLRSLNYSVLAAGTPEAALHLAEEHADEIQLLVTDIVIPGMKGPELAGRLKARLPNLKCLFMSGFTADIVARQGILDRIDHFIQKPFSMADLAGKVREALAGA